MADLEEIVENCRTREGNGSRNEDERDLTPKKPLGSRKRRNSRRSQSPPQTPPSRAPDEQWKPPKHALGQGGLSTHGDHRAEFYEDYHKVAKEYDKEFQKNRKDDLDTILIFAGLFSAVATAFITQSDSTLQPDPGNETNALLRVLLYKIDNTTFGGRVPTLPQPPPPSPTQDLTQLALFLSLALTLLCASLTILCKHWLNRYAWTDMEGSIIEHSQNRQGKLDGIHAWDFPFVMDILQFVLQFSLFLFGCGLLGSLWGTDPAAVGTIVAIIVCGILIFISVSVAGVISENCPYQTSTSAHPRGIWQRVRTIVHPRIALELRSISWILRTSLNEAVRLSAFKYLMSIPELPKFDPSLVADCFHVFIGCISLSNDKVVIRKESEQLATMSARCFFRTFYQLSVTNPTSSVLKDLHQCYDAVFPPDTDFEGLPFHNTMTMIHILIKKSLGSGPAEWDNDGLSPQERIPLAWYMVQAAQVGYQETKFKKVPRWILRFALNSLPLDHPSPPSVIADCLQIIAIDLDCDVSDITTADESARVEQVSSLIAERVKTLAEGTNPDQIISKRKAICALLPYAISLGGGCLQGMADEILHAIVTPHPRFMWRRMEAMLLAEPSSPSLNRVTTLMSPYLPWSDAFYDQTMVDRWAAAASTVEHTEEVDQSMVDALLQIASNDSLRPHIPDDVWVLLKKRMSLPPVCQGRSLGTGLEVVLHVRGRGDVDILKSYYRLVWSARNFFSDSVVDEMESSIEEDFGRVGMWDHREDLIKRLDQVLTQLDLVSEYEDQHKPRIGEDAIGQARERYTKLRDALLEVDTEAMKRLTRSHSTSNCALPLSCL